MLKGIKIRHWVSGLSCAAALAMVVAGCGGGSDSRQDDVSARTKTKPAAQSTHAPSATPSPAPVTANPDVTLPEAPETVVAEAPEPPKEVTYEEAEAAYFERNYEEAVKLFTSYTERKSENPWGQYMLGLSAWKAGDHATAETAFDAAIALDSKHVKSYINLSRVLLETERPTEALETIDKAVELDGDSNTVNRLRGRALYQLGDSEGAIAAYREAIRIDDQDAWSMNNLGLVLIEQERFDEALAPLARAIELQGDIAVFHNNLGMALERTGHFRDAQDQYRVAADGGNYNAALNHDRIAMVEEQPGVEAIDLQAVAAVFVDEIARWRQASLVTDTMETSALDAGMVDTDVVVISEADSTFSGQE